ncbi:hypothetical protein PG985_000621 [Apiospora marii]|uniref:DUF6546 domain-containing protein n=1 Tax=Apiospora marii TaxID=335849 RepID=A0ABR1R2N4_9PEZI
MTSRERPEALKWTAFPAEIRHMILEIIVNQKHPGWASLASVCREWQYVLEKANFRKVKLGVPCLNDFERIATPQKREIIQHICFDIELPRYKPKCCSRRRSPPEIVDYFVTRGIHALFSILHTWAPGNALALELNVYSPSDCEHWFKNIHLSSDDTEQDEDALPDAGSRFHDPKHGWVHGQQIKPPPSTAMEQLFQPIKLCYKLAPRYPRVKAVTSFIIRRQLRRCLTPVSVGRLLRAFSRLEQITYEPWVAYGGDVARYIDEQLHAEELSQHCQAAWRWKHLESLALTSQLLQNDWDTHNELETLLCRAGVLARKMPKLHTLVLWNGGKGHACAFIYRVDRGSASITWRGTWHFNLSPRVVKSWQLAASRLPRSHCSELDVKHDDIPGVRTSHGDAIYRLKLPCQVIDPASLWQIRREANT